MSIAKAFDDLVGDYSEAIRRWVPNYQQLLEGIIKFLPPDFDPKSVLELGCGNGNLSSLILHQFPKTQLTAVDISIEMINTAKKRLNGKAVNFQCAAIQDCDYSNESFDFIAMGLVLHHLDENEKQTLFKNVHRWLKPGGYFCISDLCIAKSDRFFHQQHLKFWQLHATQNGCDAADWEFLMQHYEDFDRPDDWLLHLEWLEHAGFSATDTPFRKIGWTTIRAKKD